MKKSNYNNQSVLSIFNLSPPLLRKFARVSMRTRARIIGKRFRYSRGRFVVSHFWWRARKIINFILITRRKREREKNVERKKIRTFRLIARDLCDFKMKSMEKKFCPDKTGNFNRPRQRFIFLFFLPVLQNTPGVSGIY